MSSAMGVRFVRCPKCGKLLTEFAQVPIYRCGGCSTLLRVKAHVSIGARESLEQHVSTNLASEVADGEEEVAQPDHRRASVDDDEEEEEEEEAEKSLHDPHDDIIKSTISLAYDGSSVSSGDDQQQQEEAHDAPRKRLPVSERSCGRHNKAPDRSEPDPLEMLRKVDELRDELGEFLARTKEGRRARPALGAKKQQQPAVIKRYYRPVRGGAPFVVCCKCWTLLQLPADFLVSSGKKTLHKLRCGACSQVLLFSFRPRVEHLSRRSESYSSEPASEPEHEHNVSRSSSYSAKKLHRLMGYSSASDVLFRSGGHADGGGHESSETSTPPSAERRRYGAGTSTSKPAEMQEVAEESHERAISTPRRRRRGSA